MHMFRPLHRGILGSVFIVAAIVTEKVAIDVFGMITSFLG